MSAVGLALVTGCWFACEWVGGGLEAACGELTGPVNPIGEDGKNTWRVNKPQLPVCLADDSVSQDSL